MKVTIHDERMNVTVKALATIFAMFLISSANIGEYSPRRSRGSNFKTTCYAQGPCSHSCEASKNGFNCSPSQNNQCSMNCKGQSCAQYCNVAKCDLECDGPHCRQTCNNANGACNLNCDGGACVQTCNQGNCGLECNGIDCVQTCFKGACSLKCNGEKCEQKCFGSCNLECHGKSCIQKCSQLHNSGGCQLHCPVEGHASKCLQNCKNKESQCSKNLITITEAPTTISGHYSTWAGKTDSQKPPVLSSLLSSSRIFTPSSSMSTTETTTSLISQSSSASLSSSTPTVAPSVTVSTSSQSSSSSALLPTAASLKSSSIAAMPAIAASVQSKASSTTTPRDAISNKSQISRTEELVKEFIYALNRTDFQQDTSLQAVINLLHNTTEQLRSISLYDVQQGFITEQERNGFIFQAVIAFESFSLDYGQYHLNESMPLLTSAQNKLVLQIQRVFGRNVSAFYLEGPEKENFITIPSRNFHNHDSVLVGIVYKDLHELLTSNSSSSDATNKRRRVGTLIMAAAVNPEWEKLQLNVALKFKNLEVALGERFCMFWSGNSDKNPDGWSREGCHVVKSKSSSGQTECSCNHMTHFAVLFDYRDSLKITKTDEEILIFLTYIGLALSIIGIILTIISYVYFTDVHQPLSQIRISLASSLGAGQVIFLAGINATENTAVCVTVAAIIQYFLMAAFCWMLVEGIYLYLYVVKVYNITSKMAIYHIMSWCFPAVMVAISLSIASGKYGIQSFVSNKYCWMSSANNLIWIFVSFVVIIEVVNLSILARVMKEMATMQLAEDKHIQQLKLGVKACVVLIPLLGVTWLFGLLSPLHKAFVYIFTILNSAQGFLIFLLHCLRNSQINERFRRRINVIFPRTQDESHSKNIGVHPYSNSLLELKQL